MFSSINGSKDGKCKTGLTKSIHYEQNEKNNLITSQLMYWLGTTFNVIITSPVILEGN